jgi:ribosomal protein L30
MSRLKITYRKSAIGYSHDQKATIRSLGLRRLNSVVIHEDTPTIRGMIFKVRHLVSVEELPDSNAPADNPGDDLTRIEGIGPKIARALNAAGITTFAQLAALEPARISAILRDTNIRLALTDTWPEQARLAAEGKWNDLTALQTQLTAGRQA